jgi:hypothetical protein
MLILLALIALALLLPARFDPAIRLKEWIDGKDR